MKTITLPCFGITVNVGEPDPDHSGRYLGGSITSDLHENKESPDAQRYNAAVDALESFILAAANAGIDIGSPSFIEAVETTADALGNNLI